MPDAPAVPSAESELPLVLTLDEVLAVLRISPATWYRRCRAGATPVPPMAGLSNRFARASVIAALHQTPRLARRRTR